MIIVHIIAVCLVRCVMHAMSLMSFIGKLLNSGGHLPSSSLIRYHVQNSGITSLQTTWATNTLCSPGIFPIGLFTRSPFYVPNCDNWRENSQVSQLASTSHWHLPHSTHTSFHIHSHSNFPLRLLFENRINCFVHKKGICLLGTQQV